MVVLTCVSKSLSINRNCDPSSTHKLERLNHYSHMTVGGNILTYDSGPSILRGVLVLKYVSHSDAIAFRNFVNDDLRYSLKQFSIEASSVDDLGLGKGVSLSTCKLDGVTDTGALMEPRGVGDKWTIKIPYVCKLNGLGGLGEI